MKNAEMFWTLVNKYSCWCTDHCLIIQWILIFWRQL